MTPFTPRAGLVAWASAVGGLLYGVAFVLLGNVTAAALLLMVGGLLSSLVLVALQASVEQADPAAMPVARWATGVGVIGAMLSLVHGGYDLAGQLHPPPSVPGLGDYPSQVDPRGVASFGLIGLAFLVLSQQLTRVRTYPVEVSRLGVGLGAVMIVIYLGRLVILDPHHPVVRLALVAGLVLNTACLGRLGAVWRQRVSSAARAPA